MISIRGAAALSAVLFSFSVQAEPSTKTLTGYVNRGLTDSCFNVVQGNTETCYNFFPELEKKLYPACASEGGCTVTGLFDDQKERLVKVTKAVKAKP